MIWVSSGCQRKPNDPHRPHITTSPNTTLQRNQMTRTQLLKLSQLAMEIASIVIPLSHQMGKDSHGGKMQDVQRKLSDVHRKAEELATLTRGLK